MTFEVAHSAEFRRVAGLPRRDGAPAPGFVDDVAALLKTSTGTMSLRPVQAQALFEAAQVGGLFGAIGVGEGKTLISFLLPVVWGSERPMLFVPGGLVEKTLRARVELSRHWKVPTNLRVFSYDLLGLVQSATVLDEYQPDALILEEGHRAKNKRSAATRRIARYMHDRPETKVAVLSGTAMDRGIMSCAHLMIWALKLGAPVPTTVEEIDEWAAALDHGIRPDARRQPGALLELATAEDKGDALDRARAGWRRRANATPGVVTTQGDGERVGASIYLRAIVHPASAKTEADFKKLRDEWRTPDGWELEQASEVWQHAQELALGMYYAWQPRPPTKWMEARRAWNKFVRATIGRSRKLDSPLHVANAVDADELDDGGVLSAWREVEPTFTPNIFGVWQDDHALDAVAAWAKRPGIVWTSHDQFARRLSEHAGIPYYGAGGFDASGAYVEDAKPGASAILSLDANREGKNLQTIWDRMLFVSPPASANWWEQAIARVHRPGFQGDQVTVDVLVGCRENADAVLGAFEQARAIQTMTGKVPKLLLADALIPEFPEDGARWSKKSTVKVII